MMEFTIKHENIEYSAACAKAENPKAAMVVIHGIGEYFGRYERFSHYMADHGYSVYGIDLPGHGRSPGIRGQIGKREDVYTLMDSLVSYVTQENPGKPVVLMGHSMGGNIALSYRLRGRDDAIRAYVASAPWLRLANMPSTASYCFAVIAAMVAPNAMIKNGVKNENLFTPSNAVPVESMPDKLCHPFITPRTAAGCFQWAKKILRNAGAECKPVYLMHGSSDGVCSVEASREFAAAASKSCTYREWEGLKHEMHNEARWKDVADGIIAWLDGILR